MNCSARVLCSPAQRRTVASGAGRDGGNPRREIRNGLAAGRGDAGSLKGGGGMSPAAFDRNRLEQRKQSGGERKAGDAGLNRASTAAARYLLSIAQFSAAKQARRSVKFPAQPESEELT
ncbi:hypothetical protein SKAU_G00086760 [Synaphobranchus kaupii]|uniref:Uncharacterized protein n=1 Tax=Synaphobranchus kaupii TaxID=118154 RepID=A0A9Q1FVQ5_SYNKA|nr:hypothetical protein SKAU_G00086760 [Synaphobranchus kaupii]